MSYVLGVSTESNNNVGPNQEFREGLSKEVKYKLKTGD